jgi:hypothetical protein
MRSLAQPARRIAVVLASLLAAALVITVTAQSVASQRGRRVMIEPNAAYDGRFTFVRLRYQVYGRRGGWEADYPAMERNFMTIMNDLTTIRPHVGESNVHLMDDPELSRYPIAYLSEPGYWLPNESEAAGLRTWLAKGGFLVVDDFYDEQWRNFERSMKLVLPEARIVPLDVTHPIFNSFFHISTLDGMSHPDNSLAKAKYLGIYEDNDPTKRLLVVVNYNNDVGDYMEWSGQGVYAINFSNDAYKIATNWIVYGLSH